MDFPPHILIQYVWDCPLCTLGVTDLKLVLILVNSVDSDELQHYAAFHLGLHCWPKGPQVVPIHKEVEFT